MMSSEQPDETLAALQKWRGELESCRQPWPEWDELTSLVDDGDFVLEQADHVPFCVEFLATTTSEDGHRLSHIVLDDEQSESLVNTVQANPALPNYLPPLLDLKWETSLMSSGGIGCYFNVYEDELVEQPAAIGPESLAIHSNLIQYLEPNVVEWPDEPTYCFQTNYCGGIFCLTASGEIVSFSANAKRFVRIGAVDDFIRYCLMSVLSHRDWFRSYRERYRIDEFKLSYSDDAGID